MAQQRSPAQHADRIVRIGTAGWSIPREQRRHFPELGSHLERYSQVLPVVEINSSFYRPHRPATYRRWAAAVPAHFHFSAKLPKLVTHELALRDCSDALSAFIDQVSELADHLGPLIIQLPASQVFCEKTVTEFCAMFRRAFNGLVVCEPRHPSWFTSRVDELLSVHRIARVAADPACVPRAARAGGWPGAVYYRLHGSPVMYRSEYGRGRLDQLALQIATAPAAVQPWCIFDNTTFGAATSDAISLMDLFRK